jgi:hypothetical protein
VEILMKREKRQEENSIIVNRVKEREKRYEEAKV